MSPGTVRRSDSSESPIERDVATTAYPARRNAVTRPAPMPCEAPVMTTTFLGSADASGGSSLRKVMKPLDAPSRRSLSSRNELLAAVDVVRRAGERSVGHDV